MRPYARLMREDNQETRGTEPDQNPANPLSDREDLPEVAEPPTSNAVATPPTPGGPPDDFRWPLPADLEPSGPDIRQGLVAWFGILLAAGGIGLVFGMQEMAALAALGGLFVAAQAADLSPRWDALYYLTSWVVPVGGAVLSVTVGIEVLHSGAQGALQLALVSLAFAAAGASVLFLVRPLSNNLVAVLMQPPVPSHTLRLTARMIAIGFLLAVPGWFAVRSVFGETLEDTGPLLEQASLSGQLIGYFILALASVGFMLRRSFRETLDRLGLKPITGSHLAIIAIGVMGLYGLNAGADWIQQTIFPNMWESDHRVNEAIASGLGAPQVLLLGLSAGFGEEITMRGALQPKLGLIKTSLLFAGLHVQYSWFGMVVVFLLGILVGTIRNRTSTSAAVAVHMIYDVLAVFSVAR